MKLKNFHQALLSWYKQTQRDLPWRRSRDPYAIWVSEIMLQQTQVQTVIPYFNKFMEQFPTIAALAEADINQVLKAWEGLGYYSRARNLHKAAQMILSDFSGALPQSVSQLKKIPGIGAYTAAAILSIAFNEAVPAVDGNIKRVFSRLKMLKLPINQATSLQKFQNLAAELMNNSEPGQYNQALMELGALICKPQQPACEKCPVSNFCLAYENETVAHFPIVLKKAKVPTQNIAIGVVLKEDSFLITQRKLSGLLGGLWEFPGGKIEQNEEAKTACIREIREETNLKIEVISHLTTVKHAYTHFKIVMEVFLCQYLSGEVQLTGPVDYNWVTYAQFNDYAFPGANHKFLPLLQNIVISS